MSHTSSVLTQLSESLSQLVARSHGLVAAVRIPGGGLVSGVLWRPDAVVVSEQTLSESPEYEVGIGDRVLKAHAAGRDEGTNVAVLKLADSDLSPVLPPPAVAQTGSLALLLGASAEGVSARLALIRAAGGAWESLNGGQIDRKILLDVRIGSEEGGPVLAADGSIYGISTRGARRQSLVIPASTVDRAVTALLEKGAVQRGWIGVALRPVALPETLRPASGQRIGLMVMDVAANSPGAKAGIVAGDIVLSAGGTPVHRFGSITRQLGPASIGKTIELLIARAGATISQQLTIEAKPGP